MCKKLPCPIPCEKVKCPKTAGYFDTHSKVSLLILIIISISIAFFLAVVQQFNLFCLHLTTECFDIDGDSVEAQVETKSILFVKTIYFTQRQ